MEFLMTLLLAFVSTLPTLLVWSIGIFLAVTSWSKHPKRSLLTTVALAGFIVLAVLNVFLVRWLPVAFAQTINPAQLGVIFTALGLGTSVISAGLWGIVLFVIFSPRENRSSG
jgi:hypothetical protein